MRRSKKSCLDCIHLIDSYRFEKPERDICIPKGEHAPCKPCEHFNEGDYADLDELNAAVKAGEV